MQVGKFRRHTYLAENSFSEQKLLLNVLGDRKESNMSASGIRT